MDTRERFTTPVSKQAVQLTEKAKKYFSSGYFQLAKRYYEEAFQLDPQNSLALNGLALAIFEIQGEWSEEAFSYLNLAAQVDPKNAKIWNNLGRYHYAKGEYDRAVTFMEKTLRLTPENPIVIGNLAAAYRMAYRFDEAVGELQKSLGEHADLPWLHFQLGLTLVYRGLARDCRRDLDHAQSIFLKIKEMNVEFEGLMKPTWIKMLDYFVFIPMEVPDIAKVLDQYLPEHPPYIAAFRQKASGVSIH